MLSTNAMVRVTSTSALTVGERGTVREILKGLITSGRRGLVYLYEWLTTN